MATFQLPIPPNGTPVFNQNKNGFSEPWQRYFLQLGIALGGLVAGDTGEVQYNDDGNFGGIDNGASGDVLTSNGAGVAPSFGSVPNRFDQDLNTTDAVTFASVSAGSVAASGAVTAASVDAVGNVDGATFSANGVPGVNFSGAITNLIVVKGIVTGAS